MTPYDVRDAHAQRPPRLAGWLSWLSWLLAKGPFPTSTKRIRFDETSNSRLTRRGSLLAPCTPSTEGTHDFTFRDRVDTLHTVLSRSGNSGCVCKSIQIYTETTECAFCVECAPDSSVTRLELSWLSQPSYSGAHPRDSITRAELRRIDHAPHGCLAAP